MSKTKSKRFDKKNAIRFQLVHRSQLDPLYDEEGASRMVLHPVDEYTEKSDFYQKMREDQNTKVDLKKIPVDVLSAVDEYGMPKDGYDYKQHLKTSGGGVFVGPDGSTGSVPKVISEAPSDIQLALATEDKDQPERMFDAITLTTDGMPEDIRQALDSDYDEEFNSGDEDCLEGRTIGEFEELQLDFIKVASVEPEEPTGFDFDAHIARLMRRADGIYSDREDEDEGEEFDDDEDGEEFDLEALMDAGFEEGNSIGMSGDGSSVGGSMRGGDSSGRTRRDVDDQFDVLWEREYGNQQLGGLDDELCADDGLAEQINGLKLDEDQVDNLMEEFLLEVEEENTPLVDLPKGNRSRYPTSIIDGKKNNGETKGETKIKEEEEEPSYYKKFVEEENERAGEDAIAPDTGEITEGWSRAERFLPKRLKQTWDSETIVSTYSNVDNHPTLLGARKKSTRGSGRRAQLEITSQSNDVVEDSKCRGLPIGDLSRYDDSSGDEEEEEKEDDDYSDDDSNGDVNESVINKGISRKKIHGRKETKAEKKARKKAIKEERRMRRAIKKQTKNCFKDETKRQLKSQRPSDGISVTAL
jgi:protein LTV1